MPEKEVKILKFSRLSIRRQKGLTADEELELSRLEKELAPMTADEIHEAAQKLVIEGDPNFG